MTTCEGLTEADAAEARRLYRTRCLGISGVADRFGLTRADAVRLLGLPTEEPKAAPVWCVHCGQRVVTKPKGLCRRCYDTPAVRAAATVPSKYTRRGGGQVAPKPDAMPEPTQHLPGSPGKIAELARRVELGLVLHHPLDGRLVGRVSRVRGRGEA